MVIDVTSKARVLTHAIDAGEPLDYVRALFIALAESISEGVDGLAVEHMDELRHMVAVYNEYVRKKEDD